MADINFTDLNLKTDTSVDSFDFNGKTIEVKKYLPIDDKYDLVMITLQSAYENGIYNDIKLDMFFCLYLVYMYTNIVFSDEERANETQLYDQIKSSGLLDMVIARIDDEEYSFLYDNMNQIIDASYRYKNSAAAVIQSLINDLPANAEAAEQIVDSFDPTKYQAVLDFAQAANGGRPISGPNKNQEV